MIPANVVASAVLIGDGHSVDFLVMGIVIVKNWVCSHWHCWTIECQKNAPMLQLLGTEDSMKLSLIVSENGFLE